MSRLDKWITRGIIGFFAILFSILLQIKFTKEPRNDKQAFWTGWFLVTLPELACIIFLLKM